MTAATPRFCSDCHFIRMSPYTGHPLASMPSVVAMIAFEHGPHAANRASRSSTSTTVSPMKSRMTVAVRRAEWSFGRRRLRPIADWITDLLLHVTALTEATRDACAVGEPEV